MQVSSLRWFVNRYLKGNVDKLKVGYRTVQVSRGGPLKACDNGAGERNRGIELNRGEKALIDGTEGIAEEEDRCSVNRKDELRTRGKG